MTIEKDAVVTWLSKYWFIFAFLVASGMAWSETTTKVSTLEDAVKSQATVQQEIVQLKQGQATLDERTKLMLEQQKETQDLVRQLIFQQKKVNTVKD